MERGTSSGRDLRCGSPLKRTHTVTLSTAELGFRVVEGQPVDLAEGASRTTECSYDCRTDSLGSGQRLHGRHLSRPAVRQKTAHGTAARPGAGKHRKEKTVEDGQE